MELTCPHKQHHNNDENFPRSQLLVLLRHLLHRHLICARGKRDRETQPRGSGCARHWVNSALDSNRQRVGVRATRRESSPISRTSDTLNSQSISCSAATAPGNLQKGRGSKMGSECLQQRSCHRVNPHYLGPWQLRLPCLCALLVPQKASYASAVPLPAQDPGAWHHIFQWSPGIWKRVEPFCRA